MAVCRFSKHLGRAAELIPDLIKPFPTYHHPMKLVKIFGIVMAVHAAVFVFIFAIPGCRSTAKKPVSASPVGGDSGASPLAAAEATAPAATASSTGTSEVAAIRFSPTRPGSTGAAEATAPLATAPATYAVAKGDNLWSIAKKNGVTVKQLLAANNLRADSRLNLGQKLVIPGKTVTPSVVPAAGAAPKPVVPAAPAPVSAPSAATTHVVKAGESLGSIAKKYAVKVGDIATANNIADPTKLRVGQTLKIPAGHSSAIKSTVPAAKPATKPAASAPTQPVAPVTPPSAPAPVFTSPLLESAPDAAPQAAESPFAAPAASTTDAPVIRVEEPSAAKAP